MPTVRYVSYPPSKRMKPDAPQRIHWTKVSWLSLTNDRADHRRMDRAVVRPRRGQNRCGAVRAWRDVARVDFTIVEHDSVCHRVDVVPDDHAPRRHGCGIRRKRLRAVDADDV